MDNITRGRLIVFDGIDGTGKSTQANLLYEALQKVKMPCILSKEPTNGQWGRLLRESFTAGRLAIDDELTYFINDRIEHIETVIEPGLKGGSWVILDRYFYSTLCYQGLKDPNFQQHEKQIIDKVIIPDVAFIFVGDVDNCLNRIISSRKDDPDEFEKKDHLLQVKKQFLLLPDKFNEVHIVNAEGTISEIHNHIIQLLNSEFLIQLPKAE